MKLLLIDNYDSFTYNLMHLFAQEKGVEVDVVRNDSVPFKQLKNNEYFGIIIGPGPGDPTDEEYFGQNTQVIKEFGSNGLPILGICLGFQGIAAIYGARLKQAELPQHGKTSKLKIINHGELLDEIPEGIEVMRYHSLMIDTGETVPGDITIMAEVEPASDTVAANGREIMAIKHSNLPIYGVQFHPESFATELGGKIAANFLKIVEARK